MSCIICAAGAQLATLQHLSCSRSQTFTSAEGAHVVYVLTTHAALSLLLEGLFLENVGLSLPCLLTNTQKVFRFSMWYCLLPETLQEPLDFIQGFDLADAKWCFSTSYRLWPKNKPKKRN